MAKANSQAVEFDAEVKGIASGKKLGEDQAATVQVRVVLAGNGLTMPLQKLVRLQKAGLVRVFIEPTQGELPGTEHSDDD